jgi:hypothetical protein
MVGIARSLASGNGFSSPWPGAESTVWIGWIAAHACAGIRATAQRMRCFWFDLPHPPPRFDQKPWFFKVKVVYILALLLTSLAAPITIRRDRREYFWLLASFPAVFPPAYYIAPARKFCRFPIDPVLAIIAGLAITAWLSDQQTRFVLLSKHDINVEVTSYAT